MRDSGTKGGIRRCFEIGIEMIFIDLIEQLNDTVRNAVHELFDAAWTNQTHPQDLLLVDQHGFYDQMLAEVQENPSCTVAAVHEVEASSVTGRYLHHALWRREACRALRVYVSRA